MENEGKWAEQKGVWSSGDIAQHNDWVRDVAWAPSIGLPSSTIASASEVPSLSLLFHQSSSSSSC
jgi:protein transport protein SEC13